MTSGSSISGYQMGTQLKQNESTGSHTLAKKKTVAIRNHSNEFPIVWVSCFDMVGCFQV